MNAPAFSVSFFFFFMAKRPRKVDNIFDIFPPTNSHNFVVYTNCPLRVVSFNAAKGALDLNYGKGMSLSIK